MERKTDVILRSWSAHERQFRVIFWSMKIDEVTLTKNTNYTGKGQGWRLEKEESVMGPAGSGQTESQPLHHTGHEKNFSPIGQPHQMCLNNSD